MNQNTRIATALRRTELAIAGLTEQDVADHIADTQAREDAEFDANRDFYLRTVMSAEDERLADLNELPADGSRPDYKTLPKADYREWLVSNGALRCLMQTAQMREENRIAGAGKYLQIANLRSFKQLTPRELDSLRWAILQGFLTQDWELAEAGESACEPERIDNVDADDFARIFDC